LALNRFSGTIYPANLFAVLRKSKPNLGEKARYNKPRLTQN